MKTENEIDLWKVYGNDEKRRLLLTEAAKILCRVFNQAFKVARER